MKKAYSFFKIDYSNECHIFEGILDQSDCTVSIKCICKKITPSGGNFVLRAICLSEQEAREKAAEFGKDICGYCISNLYTISPSDE